MVVAVAVARLATPAPAFAHLSPGRIATDFEARVVRFQPPAPGLTAAVLGGDQKLRLTVPPPHVVVVDGLIDEPFLRFSPSGVEVNLDSPTATSAHVIPSTEGRTGRRTIWQRVSGGHTFAWHENRLRPRPSIPGAVPDPRPVAAWSIPLVVDGRRTRLVGTEWYATRPPLTVWIAVLVAAVAAALAGTRLLPEGAAHPVVVALLAVSVAGCLAGWLGIFLEGGVSPLGLALAAVYVGVTAVFLGAIVAATGGAARLGVIAMIGALVATFTIPLLEVFTRGFVLSALPESLMRVAVAASFAGGLAVTILCAPAAIDSLRRASESAH